MIGFDWQSMSPHPWARGKDPYQLTLRHCLSQLVIITGLYADHCRCWAERWVFFWVERTCLILWEARMAPNLHGFHNPLGLIKVLDLCYSTYILIRLDFTNHGDAHKILTHVIFGTTIIRIMVVSWLVRRDECSRMRCGYTFFSRNFFKASRSVILLS